MTSRPPPRTRRTRFRPSSRTSRNSISEETAVKVESRQRASLSHTTLVHSQDTVFVSSSVPRWSRHVEQNQVSSLGLVDHHLVQLHRRVHAANIWLVPDLGRRKRKLNIYLQQKSQNKVKVFENNSNQRHTQMESIGKRKFSNKDAACPHRGDGINYNEPS